MNDVLKNYYFDFETIYCKKKDAVLFYDIFAEDYWCLDFKDFSLSFQEFFYSCYYILTYNTLQVLFYLFLQSLKESNIKLNYKN